MANMRPEVKRRRKQRLLEKYGPYCYWCGKRFPPEELTIEHLIPKSEGGPNRLENLRLACYPCNYGRHH